MTPQLAAKLDQVRQYLKEGKNDAARAAAQRIVVQHPGDPAANHVMCLALIRLLQYPAALYYAERAVAGDPGSGTLLTNLANCLSFCNRLDDAIASYRKALTIDGGLEFARLGLAETLVHAGRTSEAEDVLRETLARDPSNANAARVLAGLRLDKGAPGEAVEILRSAVRVRPGDIRLRSSLANAMNYPAGIAPAEVFAAHVDFGRAVESTVRSQDFAHQGALDPDRRLRVGFVSSDFRIHSCASYAEPLVRHLDRRQFFVALYYNHPHFDSMTQVFKGLADLWRPICELGDAEAAAMIVRDNIDILIDLNGHTAGFRLSMFQRKPAPIQGTYLGYPNTTGVRAIDLRFVDSKTDPPGLADELAVERLIRLDPSFLCYQPPREAGEVSPAPCLAAGVVTLGSFNALPKLTRPMVALWARLVREIPNTRLLLKHFGMTDPTIRDEVARWFGDAGMPEGRLEIIAPHESRADHLAAYARIDIGLDPFPYHGTTTTCEAFHMGIPVVALEGEVHAARVGVSLLHTIGMPELIARDHEDYVRIVRDLASDPARLAQIRSTMRDRLLRSPLCDAKAFADRFAAALRAEWRALCSRRG